VPSQSCLVVIGHEMVLDQNDARYLGGSWASCEECATSTLELW